MSDINFKRCITCSQSRYLSLWKVFRKFFFVNSITRKNNRWGYCLNGVLFKTKWHVTRCDVLELTILKVNRFPHVVTWHLGTMLRGNVIFTFENQILFTWWLHQMETFSALLAICAGNSPVLGEFPVQRLVTRSFDVFFDLHPNKGLSKQSRGWWFETPSCPLWRHRNEKTATATILCMPGMSSLFVLIKTLLFDLPRLSRWCMQCISWISITTACLFHRKMCICHSNNCHVPFIRSWRHANNHTNKNIKEDGEDIGLWICTLHTKPHFR